MIMILSYNRSIFGFAHSLTCTPSTPIERLKPVDTKFNLSKFHHHRLFVVESAVQVTNPSTQAFQAVSGNVPGHMAPGRIDVLDN
jgi:hypothetical protein